MGKIGDFRREEKKRERMKGVEGKAAAGKEGKTLSINILPRLSFTYRDN